MRYFPLSCFGPPSLVAKKYFIYTDRESSLAYICRQVGTFTSKRRCGSLSYYPVYPTTNYHCPNPTTNPTDIGQA